MVKAGRRRSKSSRDGKRDTIRRWMSVASCGGLALLVFAQFYRFRDDGSSGSLLLQADGSGRATMEAAGSGGDTTSEADVSDEVSGQATVVPNANTFLRSALIDPRTVPGDPPKPLQCSDIHSMQQVPASQVTNKCVPGHFFQQHVHSVGDIVSGAIRQNGCWEGSIVKSIVDHFGTATPRTFIDIGGNIGAFTTTIANLGHNVITVEPFGLNVPLILQTLCSMPLGIDGVKLFKVALSDKSPGQKMCLWSTNMEINNGNARLVPYFEGQKDFGEDKQKSCMEVIHSYTLDELLGLSDGNSQQSSLLTQRPWGMKIDIEGYETLALRGAQQLLLTPKMAPCRIWFEYQKAVTVESGAGATEIFDLLLRKAGYKEFYLDVYGKWKLVPPEGPYPDLADYMVVHGDPECPQGSSGSEIGAIAEPEDPVSEEDSNSEDKIENSDTKGEYNNQEGSEPIIAREFIEEVIDREKAGNPQHDTSAEDDDQHEPQTNLVEDQRPIHQQPNPLQCSDIQSMPPVESKQVENRCVDGHSFEQSVHSLGDVVSEAIGTQGCWERRIIGSIVEHFGTDPAANRTFIDIGGNIGGFTTTMANLGHPVITVEPFQLNVPLILQTLCSVGGPELNNVKLFKVALSDKSPGQKMCLWSTHSHLNNGNARLVPYFEGEKDFGQDRGKTCMEVIHSYTLDELLGLSEGTDSEPLLTRRAWGMKMDIEGYETLALRGAKQLLTRPGMAPCRIWFEYQRAVTVESGADATEIFMLLQQAGYTEMYATDTILNWKEVPLSGPDPVDGDYMVVHGDPECRAVQGESTSRTTEAPTSTTTSMGVVGRLTSLLYAS